MIPANGKYIYLWVSNESENTEVWFDDVRVTHVTTFVAQATDYGVWGDVMREQRTDESMYGYQYQGQFAERDEETGWNHFELREYDPVIGRWLRPDPMRQHWSPFVAMRNNPTIYIDEDGGEDGQPCTGDCNYNPNKDPNVIKLPTEIVVTATRMTPQEMFDYDWEEMTWRDKIESFNSFGPWLESVMPDPKAGLAYFASGKNGSGPIIQTRDGKVVGFVNDPGKMAVLDGFRSRNFPKGYIPNIPTKESVLKGGGRTR